MSLTKHESCTVNNLAFISHYFLSYNKPCISPNRLHQSHLQQTSPKTLPVNKKEYISHIYNKVNTTYNSLCQKYRLHQSYLQQSQHNLQLSLSIKQNTSVLSTTKSTQPTTLPVKNTDYIKSYLQQSQHHLQLSLSIIQTTSVLFTTKSTQPTTLSVNKTEYISPIYNKVNTTYNSSCL